MDKYDFPFADLLGIKGGRKNKNQIEKEKQYTEFGKKLLYLAEKHPIKNKNL